METKIRKRAFFFLGIGGTVAVITRIRLDALLANHHEVLGIIAGLVALFWIYMALREWGKLVQPKRPQ